MSEDLRYDDELKNQLEDLSLPGEDVAWEDMKRRLDEGDDEKPFLPRVFRGCGLYSILLLITGLLLFFIINPFHWFHHIENKTASTSRYTDSAIQKTTETDSIQFNQSTNKKSIAGISTDSLFNDTSSIKIIRSNNNVKRKKDNNDEKKHTPLFIAKNRQQVLKTSETFVVTDSKKPKAFLTINKINEDTLADKIEDTANHSPSGIQIKKNPEDSVRKTVPVKNITENNIVENKRSDSTNNKKNKKEKDAQKHPIYFSAGIGLQQLLPVAGQVSTPYSSSGRKSSLADYIPAGYLRMYKDRRWFIQAAFRYGAPQYTKQEIFNLKETFDSASQSFITASSKVKKTFYHQLPISFHYYILPNFSLGAGVTFNRFSSALVEQDVTQNNITTQADSLISHVLVKQKRVDSNFVNSYVQALTELQYQWKRLSVGASYSFGLQPYLKFTLPGGEKKQEKNTSLQIFIKYDLWRGKKK
jgi:hypothetical protein